MTTLNGLNNCPFCNMQLTRMNGLDRMLEMELYSINHYCDRLKGRISIDWTKTEELKERWNILSR